MNDYSVRYIKGEIEEFNKIRQEWDSLVNSVENKRYFHLYQWYKSYLDTIEDEHQNVYFFLLYEGNVPIGILPLKRVKKKEYGIKFDVLEVPDNPYIDLSDFIIKKDDEIKDFIILLKAYLKNNLNIPWDYICLPRLLEDSNTFRLLNLSKKQSATVKIIGKCDYIPCTKYESIKEKMSKNFRGNLRKARNKLLKENNFELLSTRDEKKLYEYFGEFLDAEASGWKGEGGTNTAIRSSQKIERYYRCLLKNYSEINSCEINLLRIDNKCVAGQFCLLVEDSVYILKIGFDEKYYKLAPGNMLLENLIQRYGEDKKIKYINLLTGSEWHQDWKPLSYNVFKVYIFNDTKKGLLGFNLTKVKKLLGPVYRRILKPKYIERRRKD